MRRLARNIRQPAPNYSLARHFHVPYSNGMKNVMKSSATSNFHLPLPAPLHARLRAVAKQQHRPATQLAKQAIEYWLEKQERLALHEEISSYATQSAGSSDDLDEQLQAAGLEHLNSEGADR